MCPVLPLTGLLLWVGLAAGQEGELVLPTPDGHLERYDAAAEGRALALELMASLPEEVRTRAVALLGGGEDGPLPLQEMQALLGSVEWRPLRPRLAGILLHGSRALEIVPDEASSWRRLVHDSLLFFLLHLSEERFVDRLVGQASLSRDASRGERVLAFVAETPSLQKLAQILARNPALAPDFRASLQQLENGISTLRHAEVLELIERELETGVPERYALDFDESLLAEASVGAILAADYLDPETGREQRAACKVLKPRAVSALGEDMAIIDGMLDFLERHAEVYDIGATPLVDIFEEIREALSKEIQVADERANLRRAREYYRDSPRILVPGVLAFSTPNVTCMEFVRGVKITDAYPGDAGRRARLARRLSDALTYDVLFSRADVALFHGDPHAGNVFHVADGGPDPYRIALLDWGLAGEFDRRSREKMVQLALGLYLSDAKRLAENADVLVDTSSPGDDEPLRIRAVVEAVLDETRGQGTFERLDELLAALAREGHRVRYETAIFVKSQLTISGILEELDPGFDQDDHVMGRIQSQVLREIPARFLRTIWFPGWNSHEYPSMMSNEDVKDVQLYRLRRGLATAGRAVWTAISFRWLF